MSIPFELPFPYSGPDALRQPLYAALKRVVDPEVALSIVDLGLVYGVDIDAQVARVRLTMTSAACPVVDLIVEEVQAELEALLPHDVEVMIELCWEPPWSPALMSESARRFMA